MKHLTSACFISALISISACGGGGGSSDTSTPPPVVIDIPTFSLKVQQENLCGDIDPLNNATVLFSDESPNQNPDAAFMSYTTGPDGLVELDVEENSKVSFTLISNNSYGDTTIYSFIDLDTDNFDFTMLFGNDAFTNDACICQEVDFDAEVSTGHFPGDFSEVGGVEWGKYEYGGSVSNSGSSTTMQFSNIELCGDNHETLPLVVSVEAFTDGGEYLVGMRSNATVEGLSSPVLIDTIARKSAKPDLGADYYLDHSLVISGTSYLRKSSNESEQDYFGFEELNIGQHLFSANKIITSTYNGVSASESDYVVALSYRRSLQNSTDASLMGTFSTATAMDVTFNTENNSFTIQSDGTENFDSRYFSNYYDLADGSKVWRRTYSPNDDVTFLPKLTTELESDLATATHDRQYTYLIDMDDYSDYSSAIKARRFNDSDGSGPEISSDKLLLLYWDGNDVKKLMPSNVDEISNVRNEAVFIH